MTKGEVDPLLNLNLLILKAHWPLLGSYQTEYGRESRLNQPCVTRYSREPTDRYSREQPDQVVMDRGCESIDGCHTIIDC
ncbi:hypothetical protein J6590_008424 [Homalodisca vitripennis]|nr:hypothetical protein J6590_008424 [Homalodisca vitripennis]